jgi:ribonucleoside-diphosphate reductase alpha chain
MVDLYKKLSKERKELQESGEVPEWFTTAGWQLFKDKYQYQGQSYKGTCERIAKCAAKHVAKHGLDVQEWETKFYNLLWKGWLSPSTPVLSNMGTSKGMNVSCSGTYVSDSVYGFYDSFKENAILTKHGFGTSGYLSDIRPRGSKIATGGKASGITPVLKHFVFDMQTITQGCYIEGTQVLTDKGFIDFRDINTETNIAQLDEHRNVSFTKGEPTVRDWNGKMYRFTSESGLKLEVTPNHRMMISKDGNTLQEVIAENVDYSILNQHHMAGYYTGPVTNDGTITDSSIESLLDYKNIDITTVDADIINFIQSVAAINNARTFINDNILTIDFSKDYSHIISGSNISTESFEYNGKVYCCIVPNGRIIVRDLNGFVSVCGNTQRRGAFAGYIDIEHKDFYEIADLIQHEPDDLNIGWIVKDKFIKKLQNGDKEANNRFKKAMKSKLLTGKGYFFFVDKVNRNRPKMYKDKNLDVKASNLCCEVFLHSSEEYSFSCVLSAMNLYWYDDWKDTTAVFDATVFLDCVAEEFITLAENIKGLEKTVDFTRKGRALGLGVCGFHTYLQEKRWPFEGLEAHTWNNQVFKHIRTEADKASKWMATVMGEPEWCAGYGVRNTHLMALMPTKATALIQGGISEGINPDPAIVFNQATAAGEMDRISPTFLKLLKERNMYSKETIRSITDNNGSVQHLEWLTDDEKLVFRTAFEMDQSAQIRLCSTRQKYVDQGQSINLFFSADEDEKYITKVHQQAFLDENLHSLYYIYTLAGVQAAKSECIACQ